MRFLVLKVILAIILFAVLTLLTQIGGIVFLISLSAAPFINKKIKKNRFAVFGAVVLSFLLLYVATTFIIVPLIAARYDRVRLPMFETNGLRPRTILTVILNRNYVRTELRDVTYSASSSVAEKFPGTVVNYLDAGFPLFDEYPLFPHLSHNDGKKIDIALLYKNKGSGKEVADTPSPIGYGVYEEPEESEVDQPFICKQQGFWQYGFMENVVPQNRKEYFVLDKRRTRALCMSFTSNDAIEKIFIEPHLKTRLNLLSSKVRYHGCQAVRHDDHIHVQMK